MTDFQHIKPWIIGVFVLFVTSTSINQCSAQISERDSLDFFEFPSEIHKPRLIALSTTVGVAYISTSIGLYNAWYNEFEQSNFHLFNDWNEWKNMDKFGHIYTAYFQGFMGYKMSRWTGIDEKNSILIGAVAGSLFQSTIEVMDGFSSKWGFSLTDMGANVLGSSAFVLQQKYWNEQRLQLKISSWPEEYRNETIISSLGESTTAQERVDALFGTSFLERFLKDYNAQSYWLSANVASFFPDAGVPKWINLSFGYSTENLLGGYENEWNINEAIFNADQQFPRYHQFLLGFDVDFSKIRTKKHFLNALLTGLNMYRFPFPAIEYNSRGEFVFHLIFKN